MLLRLLLRLPSPGFSRNGMTGDSELDAFLRELDRHLVGSSWIRRPYLLEAADHLLQSQKKHAASDTPSRSAASRAIEGFGKPARWAADQRRSRRRIFLATAATAWLIFGGLLALFLLAIALPNLRLWIAITLPFGVLMGHFHGYLAGPLLSPVATLPIIGEAEPTVEPGSCTGAVRWVFGGGRRVVEGRRRLAG